MKKFCFSQTGYLFPGIILLFVIHGDLSGQGVVFDRELSPSEGWVKPQEKPFRQEICLNGLWDFQPVAVPGEWEYGNGIPPELTAPVDDGWEEVKIKIPSPWNVNEWGGGSETGEGTNHPYAPSSVYYPSYPQSWGSVRMAWMRRIVEVPKSWKKERVILHFEAVMGDYVVLVNGRSAGGAFGDFLPHEYDVTDHINAGESNEIMVGVRHRRLFDKTSEEYRYFRTTYPPGSNTDILAGIWQDVYLLAAPPVRISDIFVQPWVDRDTLEFEVELVNQSNRSRRLSVSGPVKEWVNLAGEDVLSAPEIRWKTGQTVIELVPQEVRLSPGETKKITLQAKVAGRLELWAPGSPNLYMAELQINERGRAVDRKALRFGWRQFTIEGSDFYLNGERIQLFSDIQHPFGAYICSRRFAWAWYKMIRDFGGNCVRLHAQPWPRLYYELADEMGMMVLDESALFGSSLSLNFEEEITWERTAEHLDALILRDRNYPSVIGWSIGNELFAVAMYNKPAPELAKQWDEKIIELADRPPLLDPTRDFITDDGDEDMHGALPVWSKHFAHGLQLDRLPDPDIDKPLVVGESGATYYGRPEQLFPFVGEKAYASYYGRNEALAVDIYQNAVFMARPLLDYFSPSEVCWFGIEHMNLGYHDYSRLPRLSDGIFAGVPYEEGKPGYQVERIPPYVTTFNPGLDPQLPLYKPLPMFKALRAALSEDTPQPSKWDSFQVHEAEPKPDFPQADFHTAYLVGDENGTFSKSVQAMGFDLSDDPESADIIIIDGEQVTSGQLKQNAGLLNRIRTNGGMIWIMLSEGVLSPALEQFLPAQLSLTDRWATSLQSSPSSVVDRYFNLPDLYFSEIEGDRKILKQGMEGELVDRAEVVLEATNTDWSLFNQVGENRKCAQVVLYEKLNKPSGAALITLPFDKSQLWISTIDYRIDTEETLQFWKELGRSMGVNMGSTDKNDESDEEGVHDLLLDGPVEQ